MKITKRRLKRIIKEAANRIMLQDKIDRYRADPRSWRGVKNEFLWMADGDDPEGVRSEYYSGWEDRDFQSVIDGVEAPEVAKPQPGSDEEFAEDYADLISWAEVLMDEYGDDEEGEEIILNILSGEPSGMDLEPEELQRAFDIAFKNWSEA